MTILYDLSHSLPHAPLASICFFILRSYSDFNCLFYGFFITSIFIYLLFSGIFPKSFFLTINSLFEVGAFFIKESVYGFLNTGLVFDLSANNYDTFLTLYVAYKAYVCTLLPCKEFFFTCFEPDSDILLKADIFWVVWSYLSILSKYYSVLEGWNSKQFRSIDFFDISLLSITFR